MSDVKHMQMVSAVVHAADGLAVDYGPGELHEPGSLPAGVPFRDVLVDDVQAAVAPAHAKPGKPVPEDKPAPDKPADHPAGQAGGEAKASAPAKSGKM